MRNIPFVDLKAGFAPIRDDIMHAIADVLDGMQLNLGPNCREFEEEFAAYCGVRHAVGVASGTEALQFALLSSGVGCSDEVITSPHTFFATAEAVSCIGAKPVFADIDPATYTIDMNDIRSKISKKTRAIIPVHMYGQPADMEPLAALAREHGIAVIEDACQAHGALYEGRKTGSLGTAGCFSFYYTKNLGCYGEGGMVTTDDEGIAERVRLYRNHGHRSKYEHAVIGYNGRLDEVQAAILRIKLRGLDHANMLRNRCAERYNELLQDTPLMLPVTADRRSHVFHLYVVRSRERDRLQEYLSFRGVGTGIHYRNPVHLQEALAGLGHRTGDFPETEEACSEILSLPMYPELTEDDQMYIADQVKGFYAA